MACDRGHAHLIVFAHVCGYYSRAATNRGAASIRINTVIMVTITTFVLVTFFSTRVFCRTKEVGLDKIIFVQ